MMKLRVAFLCALLPAVAPPTFAADSAIRQIKIQSRWGGLGTPSSTELVILNKEGRYVITGGKEVDGALVGALVTAMHSPAIPKPSSMNLGLTHAWLENQASEIVRDAKRKEEEDSTYWAIGGATPEQQALFKNSFTNPEFIEKVLPQLFRCCHTDDYPSVRVTLTFADASTEVVQSGSQSQYMLPWEVNKKGTSSVTFDRNISMALANLLPDGATNRERLTGEDFALALAEVVMSNTEQQWNLIRAEGKCADALAQIRGEYTLLEADVNPNHDVTFGVYSEKHGGVEENLHVNVRRESFPPGFSDTAILLYKDGKCHGVDNFLLGAGRYEKLLLSVPWLSRLQERHPNWPKSLLWVHDASLSDKGMSQFASDMHLLGKDPLAAEVRKAQHDVAVLNVSYGDWWLILPDRRMILWRYESISGLLGFKESSFSTRECSDYQGVTGGCAGAIVSPEGELIK